jgi:hypothetical protein
MANVKITALNHISANQLAPEDVFVIDDVSQLITYKVTLSNVTRYMSNVVNAGVVANLDAFAAYANANAAALANAISNVSPNLALSDGSNSDILVVGVDTLSILGSNGVATALGNNELRISMSNTGVVAGAYGGVSGSNYFIPSLTVNEQGRVTAAQNVSVSIDFSSVDANVNTVSANVDGVETRRNDNTFYSYNGHTVSASANILAASNNIYSLGSPATVWRDIYVGEGSVYIGSVKLSSENQNSINVTTSSGSFIIDANTATAYARVVNIEANVISLANSIGNLSDLETNDKANLVSAINELATNGSFQSVGIGSFTLEESVTSNVSTLGSTVFVMNKDSSNFAKLIINVTDLTYGQYQSSEILLVHDGNLVRIVEYAIIATSTNPIVTLDASISGNNVVLNATALSADNLIRVLKFIN